MPLSPQIPLPLEPRRADRFADFVAGPNAAVLAAVEALLEEPGGNLFLSGPQGSGKSHLLNALCNAARERGMAAFYIAPGRLPPEAAAGLQGLQVVDLVCVDDIDSVAGNAVWESALFRCFNDVRSAQGRLLVASGKRLSSLKFGLPDLASRLGWGVRMSLEPADEETRREMLRRRARSLGFELPSEVGEYLLRHANRGPAALLAALEGIRQAAFAGKRRITVPLAREVLAAAQERRA